MPAPMYASSTSVSHLKARAMRRYEDQKRSDTITPAYTGTSRRESRPVTTSVASAIPPRSAPMLKVLATTSSPHADQSTQRA